MSNSHKIKRQVLDITASENKNVYQLQSQIRDVYYEELLPIIESELNKIASSDELIVIDRLELDLGTVEIGNDLSNVLQERLTSEIKENLEPIEIIRKSGDKEGSYRTSQSKTLVEWKEEAMEIGRLEALRSFLLNGYLPWSVAKDFGGRNQLLTTVIQEAMKSSLGGLNSFVQQHIEERKIQQRVFHHFDLEQILELFSSQFELDVQLSKSELIELIQDAVKTVRQSSDTLDSKSLKTIVWTLYLVLSKVTQRSNKKTQFLPLLFKTIIQQVGTDLPSISQLIAWIVQTENATPLKHYFGKLGFNPSGLKKDFQHILEIESKKENEQTTSEKTLLSTWYSLRKNVFDLHDLLPVKGNNWFEEWNNKVEQLRTNESSTELQNEADFSETSSTESSINEDGIWVNNAGLVLVAYFLPFLLEHLDWVDEQQHFREGAVEKSLSMLNYLVTGDELTDESELALCKIMLGLEPGELITNDYRLSAEEKAAGDDLIQNVVKRWEVMKNTSINGFRETFLQRDGIIYERDGHYLLRVERKTLDILMDKLPWSIGVIKLSWMPKIIMTEW